MGYLKILALDLGKFKSVGCVMDVTTRQHAFVTMQTDRTSLVDWAMLKSGKPFKAPAVKTPVAALT